MRGSARFIGIGIACAALGVVVPSPSPVFAAATVTVSGAVYWDRDNDGIRDPAEPGVGGLAVHWSSGNGTPSTSTAPDGSYTLAGITSGATGKIVVETGWFRSQCSTLSCAAGPGPDNDFAVSNQFVQFPVTVISTDLSSIDVGLLPDWPGATPSPPPLVNGSVPANAVDVAARLSWVSSTCPDASYEVCRITDSYTVSAQILNQGTTPLTGITAVLALPSGDRFATNTPASDLTLYRAATAPGITSITVGQPTPSSTIALTFAGTLAPGAEAIVFGKFVVSGGTGTPGCVPGAVTAACPTAEPSGAPLMFAVSHIDQTGDPDSFGPGCNAAVSIRSCPTGIHDKQVEPDDIDPVGHNVSAAVGGSQAYNLTASVALLGTPPAGGWHPGDALVWRVSAANIGTGLHLHGWTMTMLFPVGTSPKAPSANAMRSCVKSTSAAGYPQIVCTGRGPLSPGVASVAFDVPMRIPVSALAGAVVPMVAYVSPAAGQAAETVPLASPPSVPTTDASTTSTDNDASGAITVA